MSPETIARLTGLASQVYAITGRPVGMTTDQIRELGYAGRARRIQDGTRITTAVGGQDVPIYNVELNWIHSLLDQFGHGAT